MNYFLSRVWGVMCRRWWQPCIIALMFIHFNTFSTRVIIDAHRPPPISFIGKVCHKFIDQMHTANIWRILDTEDQEIDPNDTTLRLLGNWGFNTKRYFRLLLTCTNEVKKAWVAILHLTHWLTPSTLVTSRPTKATRRFYTFSSSCQSDYFAQVLAYLPAHVGLEGVPTIHCCFGLNPK